MLDPFGEKIVADIFIEIFKTSLQGLLKSGKWLFEKGKEKDFFGLAARKYAQKLNERYNIIRIFGMDKPIPLRSIYVRVNILKKIRSKQRVSIEELQKQFDRDRRSFGSTTQTKTGNAVVDELQKFIVLGKPGSGKTTFLKYVTLQSLDGNTKKERIPIFVGLKDFSDSGKTLLEYIVEQFDICQFPDAEPFIKKILDNGKCQLLLDGLDEVNKEKEDYVINQIRDFSYKYSNNQFILSCRVAAYNYWFDQFTDVEMADFNKTQIRGFVNNWFRDEPETAELCWKKLNESEQIMELASIPLLLTLLCLAFDQTLGFPQNRAELYEEAIDALLKKWDSSRRIKRDDKYKYLSLRRKESMFSEIANETFEKGEYFFKRRLLEKKIFNFIEHLPDMQDSTLEPDSAAILKSIEAQHGIFVERAKGIYSFSHLTFQEYFTAKYIVDNVQEGTLHSLVNKHLRDDKWREVFLLTAGMLHKADEFLLLMLERTQKLLKNKNLIIFLQTIQNMVLDDSKYPPVFSRVLGIINELSYVLDIHGSEDPALELSRTRDRVGSLGRAVGRAHRLKSIYFPAIELDLNLFLDRFLDLIRARDNAFFDKDGAMIKGAKLAIDNALKQALKRQKDNITFDLIMKELLDDYINGNLLIVECLNTECYISKHTRQEIFNKLLTVN